MNPKNMMLTMNSPKMIACSGIPYLMKASPKKHPMVGIKLRLIDCMPVTATIEDP